MKQWLGYVLLGLIAYGGFVMWLFPAERAVALAREYAPQLYVSGVSGTAWSGRASVFQVEGQRFQRVKWSLNPFALLLARVEFDVSFDGAGKKGEATVGLGSDGSLILSDVDAKLPMADLSPLVGQGLVSLNGILELQLQSLALRGNVIENAEGTVYWRRASVIEPLEQEFGEFVAELTTTDEGVNAQVRDEGQGPLQLEGSANLNKEGVYRFSAKVLVRDETQKMLQQGVKALGRPGPDGRVAIEYSGKL